MPPSASASTARRFNTVHDYSTLRLHRDGTRVPISSLTPPGPSGFRTRNAGRDARGNPIALDAAGLGFVPKRTMVREDGLEEEMDNTDSLRDKRRRMGEGVEFLGSSGNGARRVGRTVDANAHANANGDEEVEMMTWPVPSSDLLKCVHYFASQYYAARGLLSDQSRVYRRKVGQGKARARNSQTADPGTNSAAAADADDLFAEDEEENETDLRRGDHDAKGGEPKGSPSESVLHMYKAFDGSALMAIGMLLQEHISMLLKPRIPPEWEEEMEAAGLLPGEDGVAVLEGEKLEDGDESEKSDDEEIAFGSVCSDKG